MNDSTLPIQQMQKIIPSWMTEAMNYDQFFFWLILLAYNNRYSPSDVIKICWFCWLIFISWKNGQTCSKIFVLTNGCGPTCARIGWEFCWQLSTTWNWKHFALADLHDSGHLRWQALTLYTMLNCTVSSILHTVFGNKLATVQNGWTNLRFY